MLSISSADRCFCALFLPMSVTACSLQQPSSTQLPLALGFGVKSREDVAAISGKVEIAVVGTETIRVLDQSGVEAVRPFLEALR